jgi:hypothetical protein
MRLLHGGDSLAADRGEEWTFVPLKKSNLGAPNSSSSPMFLRRMNAFSIWATSGHSDVSSKTPTCTRVQKEVIASIKENTISPAEAKLEELWRMIKPAAR